MSSIAELDKWLMKSMMEGKHGAPEVKDFLKSKMRQNVMSRIANSHGAKPSGTSLDMLVKNTDDIESATKKLMRLDFENPIDPDFFTEAMGNYAHVTRPKK